MTLRRNVADLRAALDRLGPEHEAALAALVDDVLVAWSRGGKLLVCGNGGSAADSQHLAAELVGRYQADRPGWAAMALTVDTSTLTAVANDYGFDRVFARQVEALGLPGDVLLVISTSGESANGVAAVETASRRGLRTHGLLGKGGGRLRALVDSALIAPSDDTPRIQEIHGVVIHALCAALEAARLGTGESRGALDG
jgi:D-sedoheptulose 7-phosphate isomerase